MLLLFAKIRNLLFICPFPVLALPVYILSALVHLFQARQTRIHLF